MWCVGWGGLSVEVKVLKVLSLDQLEEMLSFHISYSFYQCWRRGLVSVFIYFSSIHFQIEFWRKDL